METKSHTPVDNDYIQLCVWEGVLVGADKIEEFTQHMLNELNLRVKYVEEVKTKPGVDKNGNTIPGTGGRNDLFFYIHSEDANMHALKRLQYGIRWWEDVLNNGGGVLYDTEILTKYPKKW